MQKSVGFRYCITHYVKTFLFIVFVNDEVIYDLLCIFVLPVNTCIVHCLYCFVWFTWYECNGHNFSLQNGIMFILNSKKSSLLLKLPYVLFDTDHLIPAHASVVMLQETINFMIRSSL